MASTPANGSWTANVGGGGGRSKSGRRRSGWTNGSVGDADGGGVGGAGDGDRVVDDVVDDDDVDDWLAVLVDAEPASGRSIAAAAVTTIGGSLLMGGHWEVSTISGCACCISGCCDADGVDGGDCERVWWG